MMSLIHKQPLLVVSFVILLTGTVVGFGIIANAQVRDPLLDIDYPIAELGGCENEAECLAYCDEIEHIEECVAFAEAHNLLPPEDIAEAKKFAAAGGVGPGGCTSRESCEAYCTDVAHINECIRFGEEHGLIPPEELAEAKKVAAALSSGAELPGDCRSKDACEAYCSDSNHIEECILFAETAGFMEGEELAEAKKFMEFIKAGGRTPGGCRGERECMAYCENPDHFSECVAFAEELGFISPEEAELARKTGGRGPGGCSGRDECEAYCNDPAHQEECFAFAEEHGLVSAEDLEHAREGFSRLSEGLSQAPPEVRTCIEETVGADILSKIDSGESFTPSPAFGEKIRHCFESAGPPPDELSNVIDKAPPEVRACIEEHLGVDIRMRIEREGTSALAGDGGETIRSCFKEFGDFGEFDERHENEFPAGQNGGFEGGSAVSPPDFNISSLEPVIFECVSLKLGADFEEKLFSGALDPSLIEPVVRSCAEEYHREQRIEHVEEQTTDISLPPMSEEVSACVFEKLGTDFEKRLFSGELDIRSVEEAIAVCTTNPLQSGGSESGIRAFITNVWNAFLHLLP